MASRKITEFFKPGPASLPTQPLSSRLPPLKKPSIRPVGRPRKRPLHHDDDEVPLCSPLGEDEGKKIGSIIGPAE